jgi:isopenicillin N synthase-like dioxygenase
LKQKNILLNDIKNTKINKKNIRKENNAIRKEQEKLKEIKRKKREENIIKFEKYYNYGCTIIESKIKILKNLLNQLSKNSLFLILFPKLKQLLETEQENGENIFDINFNTKKEYSNKNKRYDKRSLINSISASIDLTNMNNDMTRRLESFIDLSVILNDNKNNEVTNIFDTIAHGNIYIKKADFGKVSKMK